MSVIPLCMGPGFNKPFSESDLGRGFKVNINEGEDSFKSVVFDASTNPADKKATIEIGPSTKAYSWSKIVNSEQSLKEMMEINGSLSVSYGPMISGSGSGTFISNAVSSRRSVTLMYRSRFTAFYKRLKPDSIQDPVDGVKRLLSTGNLDGIADLYGTKFVDSILYGAQLDVVYKVTSTTDIDLREIEAELEGKIGVGPLSLGFQAKFEKKDESERAEYHLEVHASSTGVHFPIPSNPSFDEMNQAIKDFNAKYENKLAGYNSATTNLVNEIEPVAFSLSSTADYLVDLDKAEVAVLDSKMEDLGDVLRATLLWKSKLKKNEDQLIQSYSADNRSRELFLRPYQKRLRPVLKQLNEKMQECLAFRGRPVREIINNGKVPEMFPQRGSDDENLFYGLSGEKYIGGPLIVGGNTDHYEEHYFEGYALPFEDTDANKERFLFSKSDNAFTPWMSGMIKREEGNTVVATGSTPDGLSRKFLEAIDPNAVEPQPVAPMAWKSVGKVTDLENVLRMYPSERFEYGSRLSSSNILPCTVNGWNGTTQIVSITTPVLQGDNGAELRFGTSMFTKGTRDENTKNSKTGFLHNYAQWQDDGGRFASTCWNQERHLEIFVRPFAFPWVQQSIIQTMNDFREMQSKFPFEKYEWGTNYNGLHIRALSVTTWNVGVRIHTQVPYPMGDHAESIKFGVACWTCETLDPESKHGFFCHRYLSLSQPATKVMFSNKGHYPMIFVRRIGADW